MNQILKQSSKYFSDEVLQAYREDILHILKLDSSSTDELDFIY